MKFIELEIISVTETGVEFRISNQSHRGKDFGDNGSFMARNNFRLESVVRPEAKGAILFVKGGLRYLDDIEMYASKHLFPRYASAIEEYNNFYSGA